MRGELDAEKLGRFLEAFGKAVRGPGKVYLTGGATALLHGWRNSTIDLDLCFDPEPAGAFAAIRELKDRLDGNVELASPADFLPPLPGWRERSEWIARHGPVDFYHYDLCSQALAKIARGFESDLGDVSFMLASGKVEPARLWELFEAIRPGLERYPRIDEDAFEEKLRAALGPPPGRARE